MRLQRLFGRTVNAPPIGCLLPCVAKLWAKLICCNSMEGGTAARLVMNKKSFYNSDDMLAVCPNGPDNWNWKVIGEILSR